MSRFHQAPQEHRYSSISLMSIIIPEEEKNEMCENNQVHSIER